MAKIVFLGAGSTVFAKNVLGDCLLTPSLQDSEIALYDIDPVRLEDSRRMMETINRTSNNGRARISAHLGVSERTAALRGANFVVNAIQVGGYKPSTVIDFDIPKRFGLRQTIADTLGIGGIFRSLRTIPVMLEIAGEMETLCPDAWFLNYTNPMAILSGAMLRASSIRTVGLCHSVQACVPGLLGLLGLSDKYTGPTLRWKIAGINHQAWLLELTANGQDIYPEVKRLAVAMNMEARKPGAKKHWDMVRYALMERFGHYITESSEHNAEYTPYFIKAQYPGLIEEFGIPLDEYPRRCEEQIKGWEKQRSEIVENNSLSHVRSHEYGARIMDSILNDTPIEIGGNVLNNGLIPNLPAEAVVEVPCLVNRNGVQGCLVGPLPEQCAALNRTNINVQLLTIRAALSRKREHVYQAALLDPHTAAELPMDSIVAMCDALFEAHGPMMPPYT
jgi:alpha-galactosidase